MHHYLPHYCHGPNYEVRKLSFFEMQDGINFGLLDSLDQQDHAEVATNADVDLIPMETLQKGHISLEGCILCGSISFIILGVEQFASMALDFRQDIALIFEISAILFDVELNVFVLIKEGTVTDGPYLFAIAYVHEV
jgi:hypothetical protein